MGLWPPPPSPSSPCTLGLILILKSSAQGYRSDFLGATRENTHVQRMKCPSQGLFCPAHLGGCCPSFATGSLCSGPLEMLQQPRLNPSLPPRSYPPCAPPPCLQALQSHKPLLSLGRCTGGAPSQDRPGPLKVLASGRATGREGRNLLTRKRTFPWALICR